MDYNIKYLKYKNKYINLKNLIGNGKLNSEEKAENLALRSEYKKRLLEVGITNTIFNSYVNKFVDKIMEKKLDIDNIINLYTDFKKNIKSDSFCSKFIYDILIKYESQKNEKVDFLIEIFSSNLYDFNGINTYENKKFNITQRYFNMEDEIFQLFKKILILNEKKYIDIYYLLSNLYLTIEKCPSIVLYIKYIINKNNVENIEIISNYFFINRNQNDSTWDYYFNNPIGNPLEKTNLMISILIFYEFDREEAKKFINEYIHERMKWTHLEEAIYLFINNRDKEKENIYNFIKNKLNLKIINNL
jgi:hypothetical protein